MLSGVKRLARCFDVQPPITMDILEKLLVAVPHVANSSYQKCLFMAIIILAFYAFLQVGETKTTVKVFCMIVTMTNFKNNLKENPVHLEIKSQPFCSFYLDLVQVMKKQSQSESVKDGPLFCYRSERAISCSEFCEC